MAILNKFVPLVERSGGRFPRVRHAARYVYSTALTVGAYGLLAFAIAYAIALAIKVAPL